MTGLHVIDEEPDGVDGPIVVLVHGTLDRSSTFGRTAKRLRANGFRVVRYDRRGYGRSIEAGPGGIDDHVADLLQVIDGRQVTVVGHSFGGVVALVAAERQPDDVRGVIAYEAPMPWADWWPEGSAGGIAVSSGASGTGDPGDAAEAFMRRMVGDGRWERLPPSTRAARRAEGPALLTELASLRGRRTPPFRAESIGRPLLAACGSESAPHHRRAAEQLAAQVPGASLAVVEGAQHGVHLTHPGDLAALVERLRAQVHRLD